jgi:hypothetical protein
MILKALEIYVSVSNGDCGGGGGGRLEEECVIELFPVVTLNAKAGAPDRKCVRGGAVAFVEIILGVQIPDRHELEVAI